MCYQYKPEGVTDYSGHYEPTKVFMDQFLGYLKNSKKIDVTKLDIQLFKQFKI